MERLGDDELTSILKWIHDPIDRNSFSLVCKRWCRVEGSSRSSLRVFVPKFLPHFLPRFPNLLKFESSEIIPNYQMIFLAKTCRCIQELNLSYSEKKGTLDEILRFTDFGDDGMCAMASGCHNLSTVSLERRIRIGNSGVVSLVKFSRNLVNLNLGYCSRITDEALEAIGAMSSLRDLYLQGCCLITDAGLSFLAQGRLPNTLEVLVLAECDRITDNGLMSLMGMHCLVELNLAECGPRVTDIGGKAIAAIKSLKRLNLSRLMNVSNVTIAAIAENCKNLRFLDLTGCGMITGDGIRALVIHSSLCDLKLANMVKFTANDLQHLVLGCQSLGVITLDERLKMWIPASVQENISRRNCWIFWR